LTLVVGGFLAIRAIGLLALLVSDRGGRSLIEVLATWDGGWFVRIATEGYSRSLELSAPGAEQGGGTLAFFPIYPALMRSVSGLTGLDPRWAGVLISLVAGAAAAAGVAILATDWAGERVGILAGLLWACAPMAVVSTLVYTEGLFTALVVWTFIALRRHAWLLAGSLGAVAGLTRPTGIALGAAVAAYAAWIWWQGTRVRQSPGRSPDADSPDPDSADPDSADPDSADPDSADPDSSAAVGIRPRALTRVGVLPLVAGALALAGTPAFWLWVAVRSGRWDGWFAVQTAFWGSRFDSGSTIFTLFRDVFLGALDGGSTIFTLVEQVLPGGNAGDGGFVNLAVVISMLAAVYLLAPAIRGRVWWPLLVYTAISLVLVIGSSGIVASKVRFLVPIFVLAFPVARWLAGRSRPTQAVVILAAVAATTVSGTWLLLIWPYAI